jgi:hypothetical protein
MPERVINVIVYVLYGNDHTAESILRNEFCLRWVIRPSFTSVIPQYDILAPGSSQAS